MRMDKRNAKNICVEDNSKLESIAKHQTPDSDEHEVMNACTKRAAALIHNRFLNPLRHTHTHTHKRPHKTPNKQQA